MAEEEVEADAEAQAEDQTKSPSGAGATGMHSLQVHYPGLKTSELVPDCMSRSQNTMHRLPGGRLEVQVPWL